MLKFSYFGRVQDPSGRSRVCSWTLEAFQPSHGLAWVWPVASLMLQHGKVWEYPWWCLLPLLTRSLALCVKLHIPTSTPLFVASSLIHRQKRKKICATILLLEYSCKDKCCPVWDQQDIPFLATTWRKYSYFLIYQPNSPATICALSLHRFAKTPSRFLLLKAPTPNKLNMDPILHYLTKVLQGIV